MPTLPPKMVQAWGPLRHVSLQPFSKRVNLSERGALSIQSVQKA